MTVKDRLIKEIAELEDWIQEHGYYCFGCGECDDMAKELDEKYKRLEGGE